MKLSSTVTLLLAAFGAWSALDEFLPGHLRWRTVWAQLVAAASTSHALAWIAALEPTSLAVVAAALGVVAVRFLFLSAMPQVPLVRVDFSPGTKPALEVVSAALTRADRPGKIQCYNPATMELLGEVAVTSSEEVRGMVSRARSLQPAWAATSFAERRRVLRMMKAVILAQQDDIVRLDCIDTGKARVDAMFGEILSTLGKLDWLIQSGEAALAPEPRATNFTSMHKRAQVEYHPLGIIGVIAPWNYPFYNLYNHISAALFSGNAVVLKMSEYSAWSGEKYIRLAREVLRAAGHEPDLVQLVNGFGETGATLVSSVDKLIFTGSPGVGKLVMRGASATLTPCVLELGGKDAFIVCEDADMAVALPTAMRGTFQNSGQNCVGIERIYAYAGIYDDFVAGAVAAVRQLRQGPPIDPATGEFTPVDLGCVTMAPQLAMLQELVDDAVAKGAVLHCGGKTLYAAPSSPPSTNGPARGRSSSPSRKARNGPGAVASPTPDLLSRGLFFPPTVLSGVTHSMRIANEEVFGPVMTIIRVEGNSDDRAVAMANCTEYGLGATVFSRNTARANAIASRLRSGMVGVNAFGLNYLVQDLPFGGVGASGHDRFSGPEGLRSCCLTKSVVTDLFPGVSIPTPIPAPLQYPIAPTAIAFTRGLLGIQFEEGLWAKGAALVGLLVALVRTPAPAAVAAPLAVGAEAGGKKRK